MRLQYYPIEKLKSDILRIVDTRIPQEGNEYPDVFFFGSRVMGKGSEHSDIDVGIRRNHPLDFSVLGQMKEDVANIPTLYTIDVVDFASVSSQFRTLAMEHVEYIRKAS